MADWKISYNKTFTLGPMTAWVHRKVGGDEGKLSYDPPRPLPIAGKGFATFVITVDRFPFTFVSLYELDEAIRVLEQPTLPITNAARTQTKQLPVYRRLDPHNSQSKHWTSRLPEGMQGWGKRRKIVWELKQARDAIKKSLGSANVERCYGRDPNQRNAELSTTLDVRTDTDSQPSKE